MSETDHNPRCSQAEKAGSFAAERPEQISPKSEIGSTALLLHGVVHRSLRHVVASLREHIIAPLARQGDVDIFFHSWDVARITNPRAGEIGVAVDTAEVARWLPEARGIFESQDEFDRTVDWKPMFARNPMRHCTGSEEAARATLMNLRRAVESQERAWKFFEHAKTRRYERVVVARADVRFLQDLELPPAGGEGERPMLWTPRFHAWGGVNDRFALGSEEAIKVWCHRAAYLDGWLLNAGAGNPEWILMKWLQRNGIGTGLLDLVFQRIRANGGVTEMDRELKAAVKSMPRATIVPRRKPATADGPVRERFLILARRDSPAARRLREILSPLGQAEVILDSPGEEGIWYPDEEVEGYGGLMSNSSPFPTITAWSRAMYHLEKTLQPEEAVWFVEDDVAGNPAFFEALVRETAASGADLACIDIVSRTNDPKWYYWNYAEPWFQDPWRAFKPLSRKSARLIRAALDFREKHGRFTFHEVLFSTLAIQAHMRCLDWMRDRDFRRLLTVFRFRPAVEHVTAGVCHPVKTEPAHELICTHAQPPQPRAVRPQPPDMPRFAKAGFLGWSLGQEEYAWLVLSCRRSGVQAVMEIGCGDSTLALLDAGCRVLSIEPDEAWRNHVSRQLRGEQNVEIRPPEESSIARAESLPFRPDFVLVNIFPPGRGEILKEACDFGLSVAGRVLLHHTREPAVADLLASMEAAGHPVRRMPTSRGMAWIGPPGPATGGNGYPHDMAERYRGMKTAGWYRDDLERWEIWFGSGEPVRVLEVGASDGVSANLMLDALFTHPASEVHCVEFYDPADDLSAQAAEAFAENVARRGSGRLELYDGSFAEILAWMIAGDGYWQSFDFIYLALGSHPHEILSAACQCWNLLKPGGIIVFGGLDHGAGETPPRAAWSAFRSAFRNQGEVLFEDGYAAFHKSAATFIQEQGLPAQVLAQTALTSRGKV